MFGFCGPKMANFGGWVWFKHFFGVYSYNWTTFVFLAPVKSDIYFFTFLGIFAFWVPLGYSWGMSNVQTLFSGHSYSRSTFIFFAPFNSNFFFLPNFGLLRVLMGYLLVWVWFKNIFWICLNNWKTFIFYGTFNFVFWLWPNFWGFGLFGDPKGYF